MEKYVIERAEDFISIYQFLTGKQYPLAPSSIEPYCDKDCYFNAFWCSRDFPFDSIHCCLNYDPGENYMYILSKPEFQWQGRKPCPDGTKIDNRGHLNCSYEVSSDKDGYFIKIYCHDFYASPKDVLSACPKASSVRLVTLDKGQVRYVINSEQDGNRTTALMDPFGISYKKIEYNPSIGQDLVAGKDYFSINDSHKAAFLHNFFAMRYNGDSLDLIPFRQAKNRPPECIKPNNSPRDQIITC